MTYFLVAALAVAVVAVFLWVQRQSQTAADHAEPSESPMPNPLDPSNLFMATAEQSAARAATVLPDGPSEDAQHVLGTAPAPANEDDHDDDSQRDYAPNPRAEWVIQIELRDGATARREQILSTFSPEWVRAHELPAIFGFSPENGRWTYVNAADVPDVYSRLQLAWRYTEFSRESAQRWLAETERAASSLGSVTVQPAVSLDDAERRTQEIESLGDLEDAEIMIGLVAPDGEPFEGRALWDALTSLGLEWGDGDLFHWENPHRDSGDDHLFSVSTSTAPGYFFPEEAAAGRMHVEDLTFSLSVPRTYQPVRVFEAMLRAARYVQQRLGGRLVGGPDDGPLDEGALREQLQQTTQRMESAGMSPGSDEALQLF